MDAHTETLQSHTEEQKILEETYINAVLEKASIDETAKKTFLKDYKTYKEKTHDLDLKKTNPDVVIVSTIYEGYQTLVNELDELNSKDVEILSDLDYIVYLTELNRALHATDRVFARFQKT